jgi:hypothetical protein
MEAPALPSFAIWLSRARLEETTAISEPAKNPLIKINTNTKSISNQMVSSHDSFGIFEFAGINAPQTVHPEPVVPSSQEDIS